MTFNDIHGNSSCLSPTDTFHVYNLVTLLVENLETAIDDCL